MTNNAAAAAEPVAAVSDGLPVVDGVTAMAPIVGFDGGRRTAAGTDDSRGLAPVKQSGDVRLIVELTDPPVVAYHGGVAGFGATAALSTGQSKLVTASAAVRAYQGYVVTKQNAFTQSLQRVVPSAVTSTRYQFALNAVVVTAPQGAVTRVASIPGVKTVYLDRVQRVHLYDADAVVAAPQAWSALGGIGQAGAGVFVAVIDTGINPTNTMFSGAGYTPPTANPHWTDPGHSSFVCSSADPRGFCNNKVVVARAYDQPDMTDVCGAEHLSSPIGVDPHGSHVAGIAAGNPATATVAGTAKQITGVAPGVPDVVQGAGGYRRRRRRPV